MFLAGYAAVLAYGKIAQRDGFLVASVKILRRAWVLYVVHIFLLAVLMGIVFYANNHVETRDLVQEMGLQYFLSNPQQALTDELLLRFKPNLMDPLPLYIVLLLGLPLVLPMLLRKAVYVVGASLALYLLAPVWNFSAQEGGVWFFNPMAWQFLFILAVRRRSKGNGPRLLKPGHYRASLCFWRQRCTCCSLVCWLCHGNGRSFTMLLCRCGWASICIRSARPTCHQSACCTFWPWLTW